MDQATERLWADRMRASRAGGGQARGGQAGDGKAGDGKAYRDLLAAITPMIRQDVTRQARRWRVFGVEPEDVVQEVLIAIHLKRHTWDETRPIVPWIRAIARYKLVDAVRSCGRLKEIAIDDFIETLAAPEPERDMIGAMERYLGILPSRQREVVEALAVEGSSVREAARRLDMTENAVRVSLHRGLKLLLETFGRAAA